MYVGVALYEIHIPLARSLKDKRRVVRSICDGIRTKHRVSVAEVSFQDKHQRSRMAVSLVTPDGQIVGQVFERILNDISFRGDAVLTGWTSETLPFDEDAELHVGSPPAGTDFS